ncbi:phosphoenolpyruvate--protein phosphotransferase [Amnibacterium kyonggiense]|uniref:Phosphoenolpyruvate-protein phosphotransferase n=1 Tax=Amnibacterium kyonggiense TaxID=595671 RepID=A0A4R7FH66_9MICO|nr:phosphoenolpyruvate--protein phosphotransferase [Amnibacterium kyonggiense]TDS75030.1 phosphoenolpyruvate--protein phosphotransferase [Amnibacterium kyonggiense]
MALNGIGVGRALATGPVRRMPDPLPEPPEGERPDDLDAEVARTRTALQQVAAELVERGHRAGGDAQGVLEAQALMAEDPTLVDDVVARIRSGRTGQRAVHEAFLEFQVMLVGLGGYMAERAADLGDVAQRIIAKLTGVPAPGVPDSDTPFVLVARDLAPADTALLDLDKVLALITRDGGPTSHTAILARSRSIPAIVGVSAADSLQDGQVVVVDAGAGTVEVEPSEETVAATLRTIEERKAAANAPITPGALGDGTKVQLLANIGGAKDAAKAVELGAEGVGLFRTEFLFLDSKSAPTVQQQKEQYVAVLKAFPGKKVVVRALDAGADKPLSFLNDSEEENPALGLRGLRVLRVHEDILREQLTALAEAAEATEADLWVMAPMVSEPEESEYFTALARELGIKTPGVMVEVPSAALLAPQILESADFVSIGTNDLTQYTLAADRLLGTVAAFQDPWHPAVLRLVAEVGKAGAEAGKSVGICGEAAADPALAVVLVGLGAKSLSMTPAALADVRAELLTVTLDEARARAAAALKAPSAAAARAAAAEVAKVPASA